MREFPLALKNASKLFFPEKGLSRVREFRQSLRSLKTDFFPQEDQDQAIPPKCDQTVFGPKTGPTKVPWKRREA